MDGELKKLINLCQDKLQEAALNPEHPWRLFTVANQDLNGDPKSRYVVLRRACGAPPRVTFFTDSRSTKVSALKVKPRVSLCFFDPSELLQLQINATCQLHNNDPISDKYWRQTPWRSQQCYYAKESPGERLAAPFVLKTSQVDDTRAYTHFTVVECSSLSWDILRLKRGGNQRASCTFNEQGDFAAATWLAP